MSKTDFKSAVTQVRTDPRFLKNIATRELPGGALEELSKGLLARLDTNLNTLKPHLDHEEDYWKLKFLLYIQASFKEDGPQASKAGSAKYPSHAARAKAFAQEFTSEADLLNMLLWQDENEVLWKQSQATGTYDLGQFARLLDTIQDWDMFLAFNLVAGATMRHSPAQLTWFFEEVTRYKQVRINMSWLITSLTGGAPV